MDFNSNSPTIPNPIHTLLLCELCDKPFTREPQYRRHTAYCRKSQGRKRIFSCRACSQAKIKCNSSSPCHQCIRRGLECISNEQQSRRGRDGARREVSEAALATLSDSTASTDVVTATSIDSELVLSNLEAEGLNYGLGNDDLLGQIDQNEVGGFDILPNFAQSQYSSSKDGPDFADSMTLNGPSGGKSFCTITTAARTILAEEDGVMTLVNDDYDYYYSGNELELPTFSPVIPANVLAIATTEASISSEVVIRGHFTKNSVKKGIQQTYATMIIDMIYAYPRMMTRRETLPPFMHAHPLVVETEDGQNRLSKHLTNCMGIAQLFAVRSDDTRSFIWAMIQAEIRGFRNHLRTFDKYDALSAMQACLLYFTIRAQEDSPQEAKDDYEMLLVYGNLCQRLIEVTNISGHVYDRSPSIIWKDWIFMESLRRVVCVWFILGLVFHTRTGSPCFISSHFREILLPCTKTEWEAKTESQWKKEYNSTAASIISASSSSALCTFGDLIDAHRRIPDAQKSDKLGMWNAGIDNLGMVLNLTAHIV